MFIRKTRDFVSNIADKWFNKTLFLLFLLLPLQLGRHFWLKSSFIYGLRIDFLSPTLYFQDLLIFLIIIFSLAQLSNNYFNLKNICLSFIILCFICLNIYFSLSPLLAFYSWVRIIEMFLLGLIISRQTETFLNKIYNVLPIIILFESLLSFAQFIKQSSLGGIFWLFGERSFNLFMPGIAQASWLGQSFLRPYGTFSHPNSLAGFTLVAIIILLGNKKLSLFGKISIVFGFCLIILTFSRAVWLTACFLGIVYLVYKIKNGINYPQNKLNFSYLSIVFLLPIVGYFFSKTTIDSNSISSRIQLAKISFSMIKNSPLLGVGAGNFIPALSISDFSWSMLYWLQPVHNIFLLIASEIGLVGFLAIFVFIFLYFQKIGLKKSLFHKTGYFFAILAIIITGFFDHYWLTLIQNQLLLTVVLGVFVSGFDDTIVTKDVDCSRKKITGNF